MVEKHFGQDQAIAPSLEGLGAACRMRVINKKSVNVFENSRNSMPKENGGREPFKEENKEMENKEESAEVPSVL